MKKLAAIILISIGLNANSQVDKVAHFGVGYISGALTSGVTLVHSNGKHEWLKSISFGAAVGTAVGLGKEIYDYKDYGLFDWGDLGATVLGAVAGSVHVTFTINRYEKKHLL